MGAGNVDVVFAPGKPTTITVDGATSIKDAFEQADLAYRGKELRVNGQPATEETKVQAGDTVGVYAQPQGA